MEDYSKFKMGSLEIERQVLQKQQQLESHRENISDQSLKSR